MVNNGDTSGDNNNGDMLDITTDIYWIIGKKSGNNHTMVFFIKHGDFFPHGEAVRTSSA